MRLILSAQSLYALLKIMITGIIASAFLVAGIVQASEVKLSYNGQTLNANIELATGKRLSDGVILITHGGLAHNGMELIVRLQSLLKERGYNTIAINLSLGLNNRHGMYDCKVMHRHRNDDASNEIDAWVNWLQQQGATRVAVLGHSRGGAQTALYAAEHNHPLVKLVLLMAPATAENTDAASYQQRYKMPLAPILEKAQNLIKAGKGNAVLKPVGLLNCANTSATADAFFAYYGQDSRRLDSPYLIPKIKQPVLVVVAGSDEEVVALDKKLVRLVDGVNVQMKVVEGSDHLFRDLNTDDAVDVIDQYLKNMGYMP